MTAAKKVLLIEENAQDYLSIRRVLDEANSPLTIEWSPNSELAIKQLKQYDYDFCLLGYYQTPSQKQFIEWFYTYTKSPLILLLKGEFKPEQLPPYHPQTEYLDKQLFSHPTLDRIVKRLRHIKQLQQREEQYEQIFLESQHFMVLVNPEGEILELNKNAHQYLPQYDLQQFKPVYLWDAFVWEEAEDLETFKQAFTEVFDKKNVKQEMSCKVGNNVQILEISFQALVDENENIQSILVEGYDFINIKQNERILQKTALYDPLTGLPNRQYFIENLEQTIEKSNINTYLAVLFINLDRFRIVNESLGHDMGDWLLMEVTQRLQECFSLDDAYFLARSGGDEFVLLLPDLPHLQKATQLAQKINESLAHPFPLDGYEIVISASIGIAYNRAQDGSSDLLRDANLAMHRAKAKGKSCYIVFTQGMQAQSESRLRIESDLLHGLEQHKFLVFYQPQTELIEENLNGAEALIRFYHPEQGVILPLQFIPILEDIGIIISVGEWVLQTACQQLKQWRDRGLPLNHISVNLSAHQFRSKRLLASVAEAVSNAEIQPQWLELELTESLLLEDITNASRLLSAFRDIGIRVTIDDFGMGYSSLKYLRHFPVDAIKIDKSFIEGVTVSAVDSAITVATIDMAHALGLKVIAEGVETMEQRDFLRDHGCDFAQGYYYAQAMEGDEFHKWSLQYNRSQSLKTNHRG